MHLHYIVYVIAKDSFFTNYIVMMKERKGKKVGKV